MKLNRIPAHPAILAVLGLAIGGYLLAVGQIFKSTPAPAVSYAAEGALVQDGESLSLGAHANAKAYWRRIEMIKSVGKAPVRDASLMIQ